MQIMTAAETSAALPYPELAAEIGATLADWRSGNVQAMERATAPVGEGGTFLVMGAADQRLAIAKVGAVHPRNLERGLPTIIASVIITDAHTGELRALIDGTTVTVRRTSALSLYGAQQVKAVTDTTLIVGAGAQALGHLEALHAGLGIKRLLVQSRTKSRVDALVAHARTLGIAAEGVEAADLQGAAAEADTVVTTTNSHQPVLAAELAPNLKPSATIIAIGAFRPDMAEVPPEIVCRCQVIVDTLEGARHEAGDLIQPAATGAWRWDDATPLSELLDGYERQDRPVLLKTVGHAIWDLAAARLAVPAE